MIVEAQYDNLPMSRPYPGTVSANYNENSLSCKVLVAVAALETAGNANEPSDVFEAKLSARLLQSNGVKHPALARGGRSGIGKLFFERPALHLSAVAEAAAFVHELANFFLGESRKVTSSSKGS